MDDIYPADTKPSWVSLACQCILLLTLAYMSIALLTVERPWIFLDGVNLLIHEAGHLLFIFAGGFIQMSAGSAVQILVPLIFFFYFFIRQQPSGTAFSIFWAGSNFINVSVYMKDARTMTLELVGGGRHDWNWIFSQLGFLEYDQTIGAATFMIGAVLVLASLVYLAVVIGIRIYRKITDTDLVATV